MPVERSDVDISRLFHWGDKFDIYDDKGNIVITTWIRLVGDAELNRSRVFALRNSAELRKKLRTPDSDERIAYIPVADTTDKDYLINIILLYETRELTRQAVDSTSIPYPTEPKSDASLEKQEKYQKEVDDYPKKKEDSIRKEIDKLTSSRRKELEKNDTNYVLKLFEDSIINELCEQEMITKFNEMIAYFSVYKSEDYKERMFEKFEDFNNLIPQFKSQILKDYASLELNSDTLKKLVEATQSPLSGVSQEN